MFTLPPSSCEKHQNNAVGHSISLPDEIISRDSVTRTEAPLNLDPSTAPTCGQSHAKILPFLHLMLRLPAVIDFCLKERYRQGSKRSSGTW